MQRVRLAGLPTFIPAEPAPTPVLAPPPPYLDPALSPQAALCGLLESCHSEPELRRLVSLLPDGSRLAPRLPGPGVSLAQLTHELVLLLDREGILGAVFAQLRRDRPHRVDDIAAVQRRFIDRAGGQPPS